MADYIWIVYVVLGFIAGLIATNIIWYSNVWGILHIEETDEMFKYIIEFTGPFEEVVKNKYIVLRTSHK